MCGNSEYAWNTIAILRLLTGTPVTSWPPTMMRPDWMSSRPASERSAVDLPQPEPPSSTTISPGLMSRLKSSSALNDAPG